MSCFRLPASRVYRVACGHHRVICSHTHDHGVAAPMRTAPHQPRPQSPAALGTVSGNTLSDGARMGRGTRINPVQGECNAREQATLTCISARCCWSANRDRYLDTVEISTSIRGLQVRSWWKLAPANLVGPRGHRPAMSRATSAGSKDVPSEGRLRASRLARADGSLLRLVAAGGPRFPRDVGAEAVVVPCRSKSAGKEGFRVKTHRSLVRWVRVG